MTQLLARVTLPIVLLVAAVALVAGIGSASMVAFHVQSTSQSQSSTQAAERGARAGHPCNHGFYVSQAAHAHKGGAYVSAIAQSDLGKNGSCTAPLPAQTAAPKQKSSTDD